MNFCSTRGGVGGGGPLAWLPKDCPPYTPARVKEVAGQATVYIRPLQENLQVEAQEEIASLEVRAPSIAAVLHNLDLLDSNNYMHIYHWEDSNMEELQQSHSLFILTVVHG